MSKCSGPETLQNLEHRPKALHPPCKPLVISFGSAAGNSHPCGGEARGQARGQQGEASYEEGLQKQRLPQVEWMHSIQPILDLRASGSLGEDFRRPSGVRMTDAFMVEALRMNAAQDLVCNPIASDTSSSYQIRSYQIKSNDIISHDIKPNKCPSYHHIKTNQNVPYHTMQNCQLKSYHIASHHITSYII